ncbi:hypothetical protein MTO96_003992 [Rhipicephalus appendiculatus]
MLAEAVTLPDKDHLGDTGGLRDVLARLLNVPLRHTVIDEVARKDAGATRIGDDQSHDDHVQVFADHQQYRMVDLRPLLGILDDARSYGLGQ